MQTINFGGSGAITKADYDSSSGSMTVYFVKGGTATVPGVTVQEFRAFAEAPSAGQHFNEKFRQRA